MKVAVVGATGMVGTEMLKVLEDSILPIEEIVAVGSSRSIGKTVVCRGMEYSVTDLETASKSGCAIALFSAGGTISKEWAPQFAAMGTTVIDNSSAWRMETDVPLIVPEINASVLNSSHRIIANPNCSTIQMVMVLNPLHRKFGLRRLVISTYQSVSGTGQKAVQQMFEESQGIQVSDPAYPFQIYRNCLPHCDVFQDNGYTKEEMKLVHETRKILNAPGIGITATAVRVPVDGGHSESVNAEFESSFTIEEIRQLLRTTPGVVVQDDPSSNTYPMPLMAKGHNEVFVGRIRIDESQANTLNLWIVADNLRKGAATNAVQIAEYLFREGMITV
ncbi:MAG: aspartate-semialdehyde dehydrogenase [Flavobacteriales bacterium]|nr:aspartate-semialdehyde dehydrogenase [Flavobacteriales bacterium]